MAWIAGVVDLNGEANREVDSRLESCAPVTDIDLSKSILRGAHLNAVVFNYSHAHAVGNASIRKGLGGEGASLVFVGRLFYRDDLMARLGLGHSTDTSDKELVLRAYVKWGDEVMHYLEGNFAFVLWDPQARRAVCGRDKQGLQALFLTIMGSTLVFASSMELLFHLTGQRPKVNENYLLSQLYNLFVPDPETSFENVKRLTPGAIGLFDSHGLRMIRSPLEPLSVSSTMADDDWTDLAKEVVGQSVAERCRGVERVGAYISGGLDSSLITGFAATQLRASGRTIAAVNLNGRSSETEPPPDQAAIDAHCLMHPNILSETLTMEAHPGLASQIGSEAFRVIPGPNTISLFAHKMMRDRLSERGAQIVLCGWGGDQIFSNNSQHAVVEALFGKGLISGWSHLNKQAQFEGITRRRLFRRSITYSSKTWGTKMHGHLRHPSQWMKIERSAADSLVNESWFQKHEVMGRLQENRWSELKGLHGTIADNIRQLYSTRTRYPGPDEFVALNTDSLKWEHPLLDPRVISMCLAMPAEQQVVGGMTRSLARRASRGLMPESTRLNVRKGRVIPTNKNWDSIFLKDAQDQLSAIRRDSIVWEVLDRSALINRIDALVAKPQGADRLTFRRCLRAVGVSLWLSEHSF